MKLPINYDDSHWTVRKKAREQYIKEQSGLCYYCKQPLDGKPSKKIQEAPMNESLFPPNFLRWPVHLHHCHNTGMTIGAVHAKCNAYLWEYLGE